MVCCFVAMPAFAAKTGPVTLSFVGSQKPWDNEFLYDDQKNYDLVKTSFENHKTSSGSGLGYECNRTFRKKNQKHFYAPGETLSLPAGHIFEGEPKTAATYQCFGMGDEYPDDRWVKVSDGYCDTTAFGQIARGKCVAEDGGEADAGSGKCKKLTLVDCSGYVKSDTNTEQTYGTGFEGRCVEVANNPKFTCWVVECDKTMGLVAENGKCVPAPQPEPEIKLCDGDIKPGVEEKKACPAEIENGNECKRVCENDGEWSDWRVVTCKDGYNSADNGKCVKQSPEQKTCRETRSTNAGKACCDTPYVNNWDEKTQTCTCGQNEKFEIYGTNRGRCVKQNNNDNGGGQQVEHEPNPNVQNCPSIPYGYINDCPKANELITELRTVCASNPKRGNEVFSDYTLRINSEIAKCKQDAQNAQRIADLTKDLFSKYDEMTGDVSVWKNKEGEFNKARLASDSIAGVVLGTAGGLITSKVVKKSQVKSGFEDVQCTIGGQKVSDWGDEFTVGIQ